MFMKNKCLAYDTRVFAEIRYKDVVSWTGMAVGCLHCMTHGVVVPTLALQRFTPTRWQQSFIGSNILEASGHDSGLWRRAELESWDDDLKLGNVVFQDDGSFARLPGNSLSISEYVDVSDDDEEGSPSEEESEFNDDGDKEDDAAHQGLGFSESAQFSSIHTGCDNCKPWRINDCNGSCLDIDGIACWFCFFTSLQDVQGFRVEKNYPSNCIPVSRGCIGYFLHLECSDMGEEVIWCCSFHHYVCHAEAIRTLAAMMLQGVMPNNFAFALAVTAFGILANLDEGRKVHGYVIMLGDTLDDSVDKALIDMYAEYGSVSCAYRVFQNVWQPSLVSWTAMIMGLVRNGRAREALEARLVLKFRSNLADFDIGLRASYLSRKGECKYLWAVWALGRRAEWPSGGLIRSKTG